MKRLLTGSLIAVATLASTLVAAPAQAAPLVAITTTHVAMSSAGVGKVQVACYAKKACTGSIWAAGYGAEASKFTVKARSYAYVGFKVTPWYSLPTDSRGFRHVTLHVTGANPVPVTLEPYKAATISGTVTRRSGPTISDVEVQLWRVGTRERLVSVNRITPANNGAYSFTVPLGVNNSNTAAYRIQVMGKQDGNRRTWWWRGSNNNALGGAAHSAQSTKVVVSRNASEQFTYVADFDYSSISGTVTKGGSPVSGREVTVYARPAAWPTTSAGLRELDVMSCVDIIGRTTTNGSGHYNLGFVPVNSSNVYVVKSTNSWWNNDKGTCHAAVAHRNANHGGSTPGLVSVGTNAVTKNLTEDRHGTTITMSVTGYQGNSTSAPVDQWTTIREYSTGRSILSSDVVYQGTARTATLGAGEYWVETGRRQGCSAWYSSRFKDNNGYFNGEDRGAEKWKAQNYRMYREHCRAYSQGAYKWVSVSGAGAQTVELVNRYGSVVTGKVSGPTAKTKAEVLVRLVSTDGKTVYRTALTDGGGKFKVTGLAPGTYRVVVNADSWRGISRGFKGVSKVTVKANQTKSIGTLKFKSTKKTN